LPRSGTAPTYGNSIFLVICETARLFSKVAAPFYSPSSNIWNFLCILFLSFFNFKVS
jgi:hypothetical protein